MIATSPTWHTHTVNLPARLTLSAAAPGWLARSVAAVLAGAGVIAFAPVAYAASPLSWSTPSLVGHAPPSATSCAAGGVCVVVDGSGDVIASTDPNGEATVWTSSNVDPSNFLTGISCPNNGLCVAVDGSGNVVSSQDPASGEGAWTTSSIETSSPLTGVSCVTSGLCVAVDDAGDVVTSTDPTGGRERVDGRERRRRRTPWPRCRVRAAGCASRSTALATWSRRLTRRADASAWTVANVDGGNPLAAVSCAS